MWRNPSEFRKWRNGGSIGFLAQATLSTSHAYQFALPSALLEGHMVAVRIVAVVCHTVHGIGHRHYTWDKLPFAQ